MFRDDEWRTGITFWLDDRGDGYDEPTCQWFATVRTARPYGHQEIVFGLTPEMESLVLELLNEAVGGDDA